MKKLFVNLSILCLLAMLLVPMVGCKKDDGMEGGETPMTDATTDTTEPMDTGMPMDTDMTTDMTTEPMGTDMSTPPAQ
jgi:hypothetical protein